MSDPYIGQICLFSFIYAPHGWAECEGQYLPPSQYQALFSLLGNRFGGDARTNFALPDLRGRTPRGAGQGVGLEDVEFGSYYGNETVSGLFAETNFTLEAAQLPAHTHPATFQPTISSQSVTLPASSGSGSITASATFDVTPGATGATDPAAGQEYYLTGVSGAIAGPCTKTAPGGSKATLIGGNVDVDTSGYVPAMAERTVDIATVSGGDVTVYPQTTTSPQPVKGNVMIDSLPILNPSLGLNFSIALTGAYPPRG